jgi:hypothetical protein
VEDSPNYQVAYLATPPAASLSDEAFRQQVLTQAQAAGPHYMASTSISHRPAHTLPDGTRLGEVAHYNVQVWDLTQAALAKPSGVFCFVAQAENAAGCLAALKTKFAEAAASAIECELLALAADPTRQNNRQLASLLALAEAA